MQHTRSATKSGSDRFSTGGGHPPSTSAGTIRRPSWCAVIREIAQVRKRLDAIKAEVEELARGELSRLKKQVEEAATRGQNLLAEIAAQLDARIEQARTRLKQVSESGARP